MRNGFLKVRCISSFFFQPLVIKELFCCIVNGLPDPVKFQVNRLSSSLRLSRSPTRDGQSSSNDTADSALSTKSTSGSSIGTLRRQSTRKLSSEDEGSLMRKVTSRTSITSVRTSSIIREVSKTRSMSLTSHSSRQMLKRVSKAPSRLVEEEDRPALGKESSLVRSASKTSSKQLSRTPSRQPSLSRSGSKGSLSRSSSKGSMTKKTSVKAAPPVPVKKVRPGGKELWFEAGAYLTVRNEEGKVDASCCSVLERLSEWWLVA